MTLGIGEPFTTTVTVSLIFALILSLPVLLLQAYGFLMPAFDPRQRRQMRPLILAIPGLFIAGVAFGYFVVLPAAVHFFQNFNSAQFNVLVQASQYYKFAATTILAMGLLFQVPVGILAITRAGVITPRQLRHNRRYAVGACALIAAVLPGDAITMLLETVPLYLLFEASVLLATIAERRARARVTGETASCRSRLDHDRPGSCFQRLWPSRWPWPRWGCGQAETAGSGPAHALGAGRPSLQIANYAFAPTALTVKAGTNITVTNTRQHRTHRHSRRRL